MWVSRWDDAIFRLCCLTMKSLFSIILAFLTCHATCLPAQEHGDGSVKITGELMTWHKVTLTLDGPFANETDDAPNPFTDYRMDVTFTHQAGDLHYTVPGYFAADGNAGNSSAKKGTKWRAHLSPDKPGLWKYSIAFHQAKGIAVDENTEAATAISKYHDLSGEFEIATSDKTGRDFRSADHGRLQYVGEHYLRFAGSGRPFIKAGPDAPETLLAFADFDDTIAPKSNSPLKTWKAHQQDWRDGDPSWKNGKGKGLIGALNYLSEKGLNSFSFLPYNVGGDGSNVWPFVASNDKMHYDCSKLDQWSTVFDHATARGLHLHFKLQENEIDDNRRGHKKEQGKPILESLDGGKLGPQRKLYCRELIARFGHNLALNWNIGEENTQSTEEIQAMARYLRDTDPYDHNIVVHTFPDQQDEVYPPLLGKDSPMTGASLQNPWDQAHQRTLKWLVESAKAGKPWVVANDEQNPADMGVPPDPGYQGHDGEASSGKGERKRSYNLHDIRKYTLWGTLMAGGAGVEYYFGYKLPENDLQCQDFRSRDRSWDYCRIAIDFFADQNFPLPEMRNADPLIGNARHDNSRYCLAKPGEIYLVYLPAGGSCTLDLSEDEGDFSVAWFDPRNGGDLKPAGTDSFTAGTPLQLDSPATAPGDDWLAVVRKK